ncbi:MAG: 3-beta hydroxysteroid dehydrogenase [Alphaproteobacteria bacterium 65-7]|nr:MAG: 3-beta hydroxysteroid dehydrogenase [Alphaproteobacteria bacterium 65-7]
MKIVLIGITGRVGSRLASELLKRGHSVTGIALHPEKAEPREGLTLERADVRVASELAPLLTGHDAVISATRFVTSDPEALIAAVKLAGVSRLLVVGGAGSLEAEPGKSLQDMPDFPPAYKPEAAAGSRFLETLRREKTLDWTFLSPSAEFAPGERTGKFRLGDDRLLVDANGKSHISMEDFAIAMVDELEHPKHSRCRFTVGY